MFILKIFLVLNLIFGGALQLRNCNYHRERKEWGFVVSYILGMLILICLTILAFQLLEKLQ